MSIFEACRQNNSFGMKTLLILFSVFCTLQLFASNPPKGTVVFVRPSGFLAAAQSYPIYADDSLLVKIMNNSYHEFLCDTGAHFFATKSLIKGTCIRLTVEEGHTYYLKFSFKYVNMVLTPTLTLADSSFVPSEYNWSAMKRIETLNRNFSHAKHRLGFSFGFSGGFDKFPFTYKENGEYAYLSLGDGIGLGLLYGHEFNQKLDMELNFDMHNSSLYVSDGSVEFYSFSAKITPSYIVPYIGGNTMRLKLGAGIGFYYRNVMDIQLANVLNGFNDVWTYKTTVGTHVRISYEVSPSDRWMLFCRMNYKKVGYNFDSSKSNSSYDLERAADPKGDALAFQCGFTVKF